MLAIVFPYQSRLLYHRQMSQSHSTKESEDLRKRSIFIDGVGIGVHEDRKILVFKNKGEKKVL